MDKTFYITTPLYYINDAPHIGHSYTEIAADTLARYMRRSGREVFFLTGTDEHGEKIAEAAQNAGMSPVEFADSVSPRFKALWQRLNISNDDYIRTTEPRHIKVVEMALDALYKSGDIYEDEYRGWFCTPCEGFFTDMQAQGGRCPDCKRPVERLSERNFFFRLAKYQKWLIEYIDSHPDFIKPLTRQNEVRAFLNEPLTDLCITRPRERLSWGISVPFSPAHVVYVWVDALLNYISGAGYGSNDGRFQRLWPADVHIIGKDILRHHAVYWPILLHALGLPPPRMLFAHGWWTIEGEKMSKSRGNVVDPAVVIEKYSTDAYRYFLLREVPFGLDGNYSEAALKIRINSDLANDLGNLLYRTLTMVEKYYGGEVPEARARGAVETEAERLLGEYDAHMVRLEFSSALEAVWTFINIANKHIEDSKPWRLAKEAKQDELAGLLTTLIGALRLIARAIEPFMPQTAERMFAQLGGERGSRIKKGEVLFPRIEKNGVSSIFSKL